jgi:hypothetical protein
MKKVRAEYPERIGGTTFDRMCGKRETTWKAQAWMGNNIKLILRRKGLNVWIGLI